MEGSMLARARQLFMSHPDHLGESYFEHAGHALSYAGRLGAAAFCALVHAVFPFLFERTASNMIRAMHAEMAARAAKPPAAASYPAE
jgi:hypothetical protein